LIFEIEKVNSFRDLQQSVSAKYAITQLITNVYELSRKLQEETLLKLTNFNSPTLRKARQIASHDYEATDFRSIYNLCSKLTSPVVKSELENCIGKEVGR